MLKRIKYKQGPNNQKASISQSNKVKEVTGEASKYQLAIFFSYHASF